jgi:hypothetical protein
VWTFYRRCTVSPIFYICSSISTTTDFRNSLDTVFASCNLDLEFIHCWIVVLLNWFKFCSRFNLSNSRACLLCSLFWNLFISSQCLIFTLKMGFISGHKQIHFCTILRFIKSRTNKFTTFLLDFSRVILHKFHGLCKKLVIQYILCKTFTQGTQFWLYCYSLQFRYSFCQL